MDERTRIREQLSKGFQEEFLRPAIVDDYQHNREIYASIDKAWGLMLVEKNLLAPYDCLKVFRAFERAKKEMKPESLDPAKEDFYFNFHTEMVGCSEDGAGGRLHIGRSRNDVKPAALRMEFRIIIWNLRRRKLRKVSLPRV